MQDWAMYWDMKNMEFTVLIVFLFIAIIVTILWKTAGYLINKIGIFRDERK
jgi:hypothetical protein